MGLGSEEIYIKGGIVHGKQMRSGASRVRIRKYMRSYAYAQALRICVLYLRICVDALDCVDA